MESLHPRNIELGLERVRVVAESMGLARLPFATITVGGTNGKGSTTAFAESILHAAGYRVGAYTSPHLMHYRERVRVGGREATDAELIESFGRVEAARGATPLTYFEFGTLAAVELLRQRCVEIAVLEVGLGGRLDAVNLWDADVSVVTSVGLDHLDWLGPDRESVGREKAGIYRCGRPAICGDRDPPRSLLRVAEEQGAALLCLGQGFDAIPGSDDWRFSGVDSRRTALPFPAMRGLYQIDNAACALMALECVAQRFPVDQQAVRAGLLGAVVPGRFQVLPGQPTVVLDVAHNAHAAAGLAATLRAQRVTGRTFAVVGMLQDKPIAEVLALLAPLVDEWHVAGISDTPRGAPASLLVAAARAAGAATVAEYAHVQAAYAAARSRAAREDRIVVFGSFYTVGGILAAQNPRAV